MIAILKQVDENWFEGELDGEIGIFPSNYIEVGVLYHFIIYLFL